MMPMQIALLINNKKIQSFAICDIENNIVKNQQYLICLKILLSFAIFQTPISLVHNCMQY